MTKGVIVIDIPENCYECPCFGEGYIGDWDSNDDWCRITGEEIYSGKPADECPIRDICEVTGDYAVPYECIKHQSADTVLERTAIKVGRKIGDHLWWNRLISYNSYNDDCICETKIEGTVLIIPPRHRDSLEREMRIGKENV